MPTRIPPTEITGLKGAIIKRMSRKLMGDVPESIGVVWHHPEVLNFTFSLSRKVKQWDRCDAQLKSFAHMAVASMVGCSACLDFGYFEAENQGLDMHKAREVPRWRSSDVFTPLEREVMAYAEAMSVTPSAVTDEQSATLLEALGPAALIELTAAIGMANFYSRTNTALGVKSQGFSETCAIQPLAAAAT
jgi:alkylhydroperoxidase family enzyme